MTFRSLQLQMLQHIPALPVLKKQTLAQSWSRNAVVYQIYPRSFKDSNGDGIGDLQGIIEKLDYLNDGTEKSLGITALWLSPFYPSPQKDFGYDVTDYCDIDPQFGDLATFDILIEEAHKRNIKIIIDFVANHTSSVHPWFLRSKLSKDNDKSDWYIWRDPKPDGSPPNNWLAVFGGSAWSYVPERNQYYLCSFTIHQPDLNWRNNEVKKEMYKILDFWLSRGVDGIRVDAANHIMKHPDLPDEPINTEYIPKPGLKPWYKLLHPYMRNQAETPILVGKFAQFAELYGDTFVISEANLPLEEMKAYYKASRNHRLSPFNLNLFKLPWNASSFRDFIERYELVLDSDEFPNYILGSHDHNRLVTRLGEKASRTAAMLLLTLRGMPFIYNGDEIGMENGVIGKKDAVDPFEVNHPGHQLGRDPERTPMQWNTTKHAGFTTGNPWLPIHKNVKKVNVASESKDPKSYLSLYKKLIHLRNAHVALRTGSYQTFPNLKNDDVLSFLRFTTDEQFLIILNFSEKSHPKVFSHMYRRAKVLCNTFLDRHDSILSLHDLTLRPYEGILLKLL